MVAKQEGLTSILRRGALLIRGSKAARVVSTATVVAHAAAGLVVVAVLLVMAAAAAVIAIARLVLVVIALTTLLLVSAVTVSTVSAAVLVLPMRTESNLAERFAVDLSLLLPVGTLANSEQKKKKEMINFNQE